MNSRIVKFTFRRLVDDLTPAHYEELIREGLESIYKLVSFELRGNNADSSG